MSKIILPNRINVLDVKLPSGFKAKLFYVGARNILNEAYAALYVIKEADGIPDTYFVSRGKTILSMAWDDAFHLLCKPDGSIKPDVFKITKSQLENLLIIHRLGLSLIMLKHLKIDCTCQVEKLVGREFFKSEYVLYIGREFARKKHKVQFIKENPTTKTPDLLIDDNLYVECKSRDSGNNILNSFKKAYQQIPSKGPGMICIDLPKDVNMDKGTSLVAKEAVGKMMQNHARINFCLLTQINLYIDTTVGVENEISKILIAHPSPVKLKSNFPAPYDVFSEFVA